MLNLDLLYKNIDLKRKDYLIKNNQIILNVLNDSNVFNASYLLKVLANIKVIRDFKIKKYDLILNFHGKDFGDESVILYFELVIYDLIKKGFKTIKLNFHNLASYSMNYRLYLMSRLYRLVAKKRYLLEQTPL